MKEGFDKALAFTLRWEGGFSNNPADRGGATMRGVTQAVYDGYRRRNGLKTRTVQLIDDVELHAIYRRQYWDAVVGDFQPTPLDLVLFDCAVNHGQGRALKWLNRARAAHGSGATGMELARAVVDMRVTFYYAIVRFRPSQKVFLNGWLNRARALKKEIGY